MNYTTPINTTNEELKLEVLVDKNTSSIKALAKYMDSFTEDEIFDMLCSEFKRAVENNTLFCNESGWRFDTPFASIRLVENLDESSPYKKHLSFTFKFDNYNRGASQLERTESVSPVLPRTLDEVIFIPADLVRLNFFVTGIEEYPSDEIIQTLKKSYSVALQNDSLFPYGKGYNFYINLKTERGEDIIGGIKPILDESGSQSWMLNYIGYRECLNANAMSDAFWEYAELQGTTYLEELSALAREEEWSFKDGRDKYEILKNYLSYTFYKLQLEGKICTNREGNFSAFNTGLPSKDFEPIYICFTKSSSDSKWQYCGVCTAAKGFIGKRLVSCFTQLPKQAQYINSKDDIIYDKERTLFVDTSHIIMGRIHRIPTGFLKKHLYCIPEMTETIEKIEQVSDPQEKELLYRTLKKALDNSYVAQESLTLAVNNVVEKARKIIHWNYRLAVPSYYPKGDTTSLLLPMDFLDEGTPQAALVVQLTESGNYIGHTLLSMKDAYLDARLISSQESSWLTP